MSNLSECSPACNCMYCRLSQDSSIEVTKRPNWEAFVPEDGDNTHNTVLLAELPRIERFSDLPDGTGFYLAQTYTYGSQSVFIKTMEDGKHHNAAWVHDSNKAFFLNHDTLVVPFEVTKPEVKS